MPKRVMILEDTPDLRTILIDVVESAGHEVAYAGADRDCLQRILAAPPDLIFLDLVMGDIKGGDIYAALRQDPRTKTLPIIVCTVHRQQSVSRKLGKESSDEDPNLQMLFKPFAIAQALMMLRSMLGDPA
ncbi:MAG: response regulator [Elusimicrobia bacterium]|nr:response regulator [Elusimicrobiota bacterium]